MFLIFSRLFQSLWLIQSNVMFKFPTIAISLLPQGLFSFIIPKLVSRCREAQWQGQTARLHLTGDIVLLVFGHQMPLSLSVLRISVHGTCDLSSQHKPGMIASWEYGPFKTNPTQIWLLPAL